MGISCFWRKSQIWGWAVANQLLNFWPKKCVYIKWLLCSKLIRQEVNFEWSNDVIVIHVLSAVRLSFSIIRSGLRQFLLLWYICTELGRQKCRPIPSFVGDESQHLQCISNMNFGIFLKNIESTYLPDIGVHCNIFMPIWVIGVNVFPFPFYPRLDGGIGYFDGRRNKFVVGLCTDGFEKSRSFGSTCCRQSCKESVVYGVNERWKNRLKYNLNRISVDWH